EMGKVETQAIWSIQRTGLLDVCAKNVAERGVDQVRAGVIAHDAIAAFGIGDDGDAIADAESFLCGDFMCDQSCDGIKRAGHFREELRFGIVVERPSVADLSA